MNGIGAGTKLAAVYNLLSDGNAHTGEEIRAVGGGEGTRRVRDLRALGYDVKAEKTDAGWVYRLPVVPWGSRA